MKITLAEIKNVYEYEKVRERERARVIELKKNRRVSVGDNLTFLFENRDTVLFQIQEMVRTERIVADAKVQEEIDAYAPLVPTEGELSATLFIEIPELVRMSMDEVRRTVNRFQGLDRGCVFLAIGDPFRIPARFEADPGQKVRLLVDHPNYTAERELTQANRRELLQDLA
jgi:hypothetical protein